MEAQPEAPALDQVQLDLLEDLLICVRNANREKGRERTQRGRERTRGEKRTFEEHLTDAAERRHVDLEEVQQHAPQYRQALEERINARVENELRAAWGRVELAEQDLKEACDTRNKYSKCLG
jgi:hypothetical protein